MGGGSIGYVDPEDLMKAGLAALGMIVIGVVVIALKEILVLRRRPKVSVRTLRAYRMTMRSHLDEQVPRALS
jgi:hypothetical protein